MLRVLLFDDTHNAKEILRPVLTSGSYQIAAEESNPDMLLERTKTMQPDLIVIHSYPISAKTLEAARLISEQMPRPIVLFTDDDNPDYINQGIQSGIAAYVIAGMQPKRIAVILDIAIKRFEKEQGLRAELKNVKTKLADRPFIEKAKGILMQQKKCSEEQAYSMMRKMAMNRKKKIVDIANDIIAYTKIMENSDS